MLHVSPRLRSATRFQKADRFAGKLSLLVSNGCANNVLRVETEGILMNKTAERSEFNKKDFAGNPAIRRTLPFSFCDFTKRKMFSVREKIRKPVRNLRQAGICYGH